MKRLYSTSFVILGSVSFILTIGIWLRMPLLTAILPPEDTFPLHIFLASITASIGASLLWIGVSGELGAVRGGAIDLAVFYVGLTLFQFRSAQHTLAGVLLCIIAVIVSLGFFLRFRRFPTEDNRLMPLPVRISFGIFFMVLLLVGSVILFQVPDVFPWTLNPMSSAIVGCFFLGSSCYFLYGLIYHRWHNASGQLWSFLAYDIVLIVPLLLHFATATSAQLPSLIVNTIFLVSSAALALYYLLIKKETRAGCKIASLPSPAKLLLEWSK
jgi:hypothetical protein